MLEQQVKEALLGSLGLAGGVIVRRVHLHGEQQIRVRLLQRALHE